MTALPCARREDVRAPWFLWWTAFSIVFGALLMPLSVTTASGQNQAAPETGSNLPSAARASGSPSAAPCHNAHQR